MVSVQWVLTKSRTYAKGVFFSTNGARQIEDNTSNENESL